MHGKIWCDQITVKDYHSLLSSGSAGALSVSLSSLDSSACCRISDSGFTGFETDHGASQTQRGSNRTEMSHGWCSPNTCQPRAEAPL